MTKDVGILILGLLVAAVPFLGFTRSIEDVIFTVCGLIIAFLAFLVRSDLSEHHQAEKTDSFAQNGPPKPEPVESITERVKKAEHEEKREDE